MLQIDKTQTIQGVQIFGDSVSLNHFYAFPETAGYRLDHNGLPVFKFLKYRLPVDREDGTKGGGFLIFDAEFVVPEAKLGPIKKVLQAQVDQAAAAANRPSASVTLGQPTYIDGEAKLNFLNSSSVMVLQVFNPAKPSLIGRNITPFSVELTPEGATLAEQALQGLGGVVQVSYKLVFLAALPPLRVVATFNSKQFYSFVQTIDIDWRIWREDSYRETLREQMSSSESTNVVVEQGGADDESTAKVRDWAQRTLEKKVEQKMIAQLTPVPDDERKRPKNIENVTRDISKTSVSSFTLRYNERSTEEWDIYPQGTLPNITTLKGPGGKPLKWSDFATEIDLDDPFFRQLRVDVVVNADFEKLPIHSVEVKVQYKGKPMPRLGEGPEGEAVFDGADDVAKFATFVDGDDFQYQYSYQVNYEGTAQIFQSEPITTDEGAITVGVDDVGILLVDIAPGDVNWTDVKSLQVRFNYEDPDEGVGLLEEVFVLTEAQPTAQFKEIIFKPFRKAYTYQVKYFMEDGREYQTGEQTGRSHNLFINDPFRGRKTVKVVGVGDFAQTIQNIFLDLRYDDAGNKYSLDKPVVLNADTPFMDWTFPVVDENLGDVNYSGTVVFKDGTTKTIDPVTTDASAIMVPKPPVANLEIQVVTDLLDFTVVKLARLLLTYAGGDAVGSATQSFVFSPANNGGTTVRFPVFDPARTSFSWHAQYFMVDQTKKEARADDVTDAVLILEVPA